MEWGTGWKLRTVPSEFSKNIWKQEYYHHDTCLPNEKQGRQSLSSPGSSIAIH